LYAKSPKGIHGTLRRLGERLHGWWGLSKNGSFPLLPSVALNLLRVYHRTFAKQGMSRLSKETFPFFVHKGCLPTRNEKKYEKAKKKN